MVFYYFFNHVYLYGCSICPWLALTLRIKRSNTTDRSVFRAPRADSWLPSVTGSLQGPPRSLESWAVEGTEAAVSAAHGEAEPGAGPGPWTDPDHMVTIFPEPGPAR